MVGFQKCNNGHLYKEGMPECPYCPSEKTSSGPAVDLNKTQITSNYNDQTSSSQMIDSADKTAIINPTDATDIFPSNEKTEHIVNPTSSQAKKNKLLDRTFIQGVEEIPGEEGNNEVDHKPVGAPRASRRMVGWLVSYTLDSMGLDYRLFEGNNTLGRDNNNSIIIKQDSVISSKHINILFRKDRYWIRDEMSANGTILNGEDLDLDKVYELHDGDTIKIGNTIFKFKCSL